jgi:hypothetical protein
LGLQVRDNGRKTFTLDYTSEGRRRRYFIGKPQLEHAGGPRKSQALTLTPALISKVWDERWACRDILKGSFQPHRAVSGPTAYGHLRMLRPTRRNVRIGSGASVPTAPA